MTGLDALRLRTRRLTPHDVAPGDYVLCWLMQALRADANPALDAAIALGNRLGLPVVVLHALENRYPYASHRLHRFILEASRELEAGVEARGLRFVRWVRRAPGTDGESEVDLVDRLAARAASVVCDDVPTFVTRDYADSLATRLDRAVLGVDACCAVPMNAFPQHLRTTPAFRAAHTPLRAEHVATDTTQTPDLGPFAGDLGADSERLGDDAALDALIATCGVDMSLPPAPGWTGARTVALAQLQAAVAAVVPRYKATRNNPALAAGSARLSPWMHFGVLSPLDVARAIYDAEAAGDVSADARWKFLDETLTWREYYHHRCRHEAGWTRYSGLPDAARDTLDAHRADPRPALYSLGELARGETASESWNAAQKQFLLDGWMNNNLRMFWVKQILLWTPTPEAGFATACYLNDRFSLDGRDASTYGGIRWGFGDAKPGYRELPVLGWVGPKGDTAIRKRDGASDWLAEQAARPALDVAIPADPDEAFARYL